MSALVQDKNNNNNTVFDVVVIGLGAHGSASLYHLAKSGLKVLGLERFQLAHTMGSSHGDTRITRKMVFEHPTYVDLVTSSYEGFEELARISPREIFKQTGGLFMGKPDSELIRSCLDVAKAKNLNIKILNSKQIHELNPQFDLQGKDDIVGVYDEQAGVLFPENCILSFVEQAVKQYGACAQTGVQYLSHKFNQDHYEILTDVGNFKAKKIVLACGMWNQKIFKKIPLEVRKIQLFWFGVPSNADMGLDKCPIFMYEVDRNPLYYVYGFPNFKGQGVKVGFSPNQHNHIVQCPDKPVRSVDTSEKDRIRHMMSEFLPQVSQQQVKDQKECFVTMAPDEHFIIDFSPDDKNILILSPCSAHGFKYSAGVGKLAAQMIKTGECDGNYKTFRLNRFEGKQKQLWSDKFIQQKQGNNPFAKYYQNQQSLSAVPKL